MAELTRKNNSHTNHKTQKNHRKGRYDIYGIDFDIDDYIELHKENIEKALVEAKPSHTKKEIVLMIYNHGHDLPHVKINPRYTDKVRCLVSGNTGHLFMQTGIYKDKLLNNLYKSNFHKIGLKYRKQVVENTIKMNSGEYTKLHLYGQTNPERMKLRYKVYQEDRDPENLFEPDGMKSRLNYNVKHIKPSVEHVYGLDVLNNTMDPMPRVKIPENKFGIFSVLSSTESEDKNFTVFGTCGNEDGTIDYSKASPDNFDLIQSRYWLYKIGNIYSAPLMVKHRFKEKRIFLSNILRCLKSKYDNIYIIDISCRDLSRHLRVNPSIKFNREQINFNERSQGSYSPTSENKKESAENGRAAAAN